MSCEISVIVCTRDRAASLQACLARLAAQDLDPARYEIVVVDNASSDDTPEVVSRFAAQPRAPALVAVHEAAAGLSRARNAGLSAAHAPLVAYCDDDVLVPSHWLRCGVEAFAATAGIAAVGGPVQPRYLCELPDWFLAEYESHSWGPAERDLQPGESFSGGNMMFRAAALRSIGGFPTDLGLGSPVGTGEETWVFLQLWRALEAPRFRYLPQLAVEHCIDEAKVSVGFVLRRAVANGRASLLYPALAPPRWAWLPEQVKGFPRLAWFFLRACARGARYPHWQRWAIEELAPVANVTGRWLESLWPSRARARARAVD